MRINLGTVLRTSVPVAINGQVMLDRSGSRAFVTSSTYLDMLDEFQPGSLRWPTTGHDNLPRSHPMAPKHTYKFGAFPGTKAKGNLWHPNYNGPGYLDEDGNPSGDGTGLTGASDISTIIDIDAFKTIDQHLVAQGIDTIRHIFINVQVGYSEAIDQNGVGGTDGVYDWYVDPYPKDIDGNSISVGTNNLLTSTYLENRRLLKYLIETAGIPHAKIVINVDGEAWRGLPVAGPWGLTGGTDQDLIYQWLADIAAPALADLKSYAVSQGWTGVRFAIGFLESVEGGRVVPTTLTTAQRNQKHLSFHIIANGTAQNFAASSMHYRGDWPRFLSEPTLYYAFPTIAGDIAGVSTGKATWQQASDWTKWFGAQHGNSNLKLLPMANSVGDAADSTPTTAWAAHFSYIPGNRVTKNGDTWLCLVPHTSSNKFTDDTDAGFWELVDTEVQLPQWQMGIVGIQQKIEQIKSDIEIAQDYPGLNGQYENAGFNPSQGLTGGVSTVFTKFPIYHALKTFGPILQRGADVIDITSDEPGLVSLALQWINEAGETIISNWLLNKDYTGDLYGPSPIVGLPKTVPITIEGTSTVTVDNVRRFSESETTNAVVTDAVTVVGDNLLSVVLPPFSATYFEVTVDASLSGLIIPADGSGRGFGLSFKRFPHFS
jgi:hypothetical protein